MFVTCEYCKLNHLIEIIDGYRVFWCAKAQRYFKLHHERTDVMGGK